MRPYGGPNGALSPSFTAFFTRISTLSMPSVSAISSISDSVASAAIGEPGARYAATFGLLTTTS